MNFSALYGALRTRLADPNDTRWSLQEKKDAINSIYRDFCTETRIVKKWITLASQVDQADSEYIYLDFELLDIGDVVSASLGRKLTRISLADAVDVYPDWDTLAGTPTHFIFGEYGTYDAGSYPAQVCRVFPAPATALDDLKTQAILIPADLNGDSTVPQFPTPYHECLVDGAAAKLVTDANQARDIPAAQLWLTNYLTKRESARIQAAANFNTSPTVVSTSWL